MSEVLKEEYDFSKVGVPANDTFLQPGQYYLNITECTLGKSKNGNQFLAIKFSGKHGSVVEKFYLTPGAFPRLQYLHEQWFGKRTDKTFANMDAVAAYFIAAFTADKTKAIRKGVIVGGTQAPNGNVYGNLPYSNYVLPDDMNFTESPFEQGSVQWMSYVKINTTPASSTDDVVMAPSTEDVRKADPLDDLPF